MSAIAGDDLVVRIESVVSATPGVSGLFRAGSGLGRMIDTAARVLGMREDGEHLVTVEGEDADLRIDVAIGVLAGFGARDTVRRVHDAIVAEFRHDGWENANVRVTVVHIADDATTTPEHTASAEEGDDHD